MLEAYKASNKSYNGLLACERGNPVCISRHHSEVANPACFEESTETSCLMLTVNAFKAGLLGYECMLW